MANDLEGRVKQLEQQAEEERIEQQVEARVGRPQQPMFVPYGGGGPSVITEGGGGGLGSVIGVLVTVGAIGGTGYWAYTNGYLAFVLGPYVKGPGAVQAGSAYKFGVVGLASGGSYQYQVIYNDGSQGPSGSGTAGVDGTATISVTIDSSAVSGKAQLQVTDESSGKTGKKGFTITGGGSTTTGGGGGGGGGGSGNLVATGPNAVLAGANYVFHVTGATPNNYVKLEIKTSAGGDFYLLPNPGTDSTGTVGVQFQIGPNISLGTLTIVVTDLGTGQSTVLTTNVVPTAV